MKLQPTPPTPMILTDFGRFETLSKLGASKNSFRRANAVRGMPKPTTPAKAASTTSLLSIFQSIL
jgi:hypothetical protein